MLKNGPMRRNRRYVRQADLLLDLIHGDRTRRSARGLHSRLASDSADERASHQSLHEGHQLGTALTTPPVPNMEIGIVPSSTIFQPVAWITR